MKYREEWNKPLEESNIMDFGMGKCSYQNCCKFASRDVRSVKYCDYHYEKRMKEVDPVITLFTNRY